MSDEKNQAGGLGLAFGGKKVQPAGVIPGQSGTDISTDGKKPADLDHEDKEYEPAGVHPQEILPEELNKGDHGDSSGATKADFDKAMAKAKMQSDFEKSAADSPFLPKAQSTGITQAELDAGAKAQMQAESEQVRYTSSARNLHIGDYIFQDGAMSLPANQADVFDHMMSTQPMHVQNLVSRVGDSEADKVIAQHRAAQSHMVAGVDTTAHSFGPQA